MRKLNLTSAHIPGTERLAHILGLFLPEGRLWAAQQFIPEGKCGPYYDNGHIVELEDGYIHIQQDGTFSYEVF